MLQLKSKLGKERFQALALREPETYRGRTTQSPSLLFKFEEKHATYTHCLQMLAIFARRYQRNIRTQHLLEYHVKFEEKRSFRTTLVYSNTGVLHTAYNNQRWSRQ